MCISWVEKAAAEYSPEILDEAKCRLWAISLLHPNGASCPACKKKVENSRRIDRFLENKRINCISCGRKFRAVSGTELSGMHLDFRGLFYMLQQYSAGVNAQEISRKMRVDGNTVRLWISKLKG